MAGVASLGEGDFVSFPSGATLSIAPLYRQLIIGDSAPSWLATLFDHADDARIGGASGVVRRRLKSRHRVALSGYLAASER